MLVCDFRSAFCTRDRGCSAHPAFPAPSNLRDDDTQTSGVSRRENADVYPLFDIRIEALDPSLPRSEATKQSTLRMTAMDCFRLRSLSYGGQVAEPVIGRRFARPVGSQ